MNFDLNDMQSMLADSIEKYISNEYDFESRQKYAASKQGYSTKVWQTFAELGWTVVPFSEEDGGFDGGAIDLMVVMERFGRGLLVEPYLANIVLAGGILKRLASTQQKERWLYPVIAGEKQAALAHVEPQSRYDLANIRCTAEQRDDGWLLNGAKSYVLNARNANVLVVAARTSAGTSSEQGISLFVIDPASTGIAITDYATVDGHQAGDISLLNVSAPKDALLGEPGNGFAALDATIDDAILAVCAEAVGIMQVLTDKTVEYSKSRVQFGVPIGSFQALQHRMVDMLTGVEQARSLLMWATMVNANGSEDAKRAVSSIKYMVGTTGRKIGEEAVQIHGGMGVTWELDVAHYFKRLITIGQIFGNSDWHLDKLADCGPARSR
ncbi:MAG TPA: acyl-CoA dehydrogenase family protein [Woeseiaceae bacterium]|nr:acyl-CoA dehydrogenase family protein [Woeseiaceae bacterium]